MATTITWRGGNGHWSQQAQWQPLQLPGSGQDVLLGAGSYTVTLDSVGAALNVAIGSGATLAITGELDLAGTLTPQAGAVLQLDGLVVGGTLSLGAGSVAVAGGTLEGVAVTSGFANLPDITIDAATVADSASFGAIAVAGTLALLDGTYDNATFQLDQTNGGTTLLATADSGQVVFGSNAVVTLTQNPAIATNPNGTTVAGLIGAGTIVNNGTILSAVGNAAGTPLEIASASFVNAGGVVISPLQVPDSTNAIIGYQSGPHGLKTPIYGQLNWTQSFAPTLDIAAGNLDNVGNIGVVGGTLEFTGADVANSGGISLVDAATQILTVDPTGVASITTGSLATEIVIGAGVASFINTGTLSADSIVLQGSVSLADLGTVQGELMVTGTLDLGGGTLNAGLYNGVTIEGTVANGTLLPGTGSVDLVGATLDNIALVAGNLSVTGPTTLIDPPRGSTVTLDGNTTRLQLSGGDAVLTIAAGNVGVIDKIALPIGGSETFDPATTLTVGVAHSTVEIGGGLSTLVNNGQFNVTGATLIVLATLDGIGSIALAGNAAATLEALAATAAPTVSFGKGNNLLVMPGTGALGVTLTGVRAGDAVDLVSVSSTPNGPFGVGGAAALGDTLLVTGASGQTASIPLSAPLGGVSFTVSPDGSGGTLIDVACFAAATRIATLFGEVPVESLRPGDMLRLADGAVAPVRWVGCTALDLVRHPDPARAAPVRILAGAFADGVPARDLLVSPEHCLLIDGALTPAARLANGATIARDDGFARVVYWHVELEHHAVLLAEGLPAETYLDTGNRALFAGQAGVRALHPDLAGAPDAAALAIWAARGAAPLRLDAPEARAALIARAHALGWRQAPETGLTLSIGGAPLHTGGTPSHLRVWLPAGTRAVRLRSRSLVPAERTTDSGDTRRLGVGVHSVLLAGWPPHPDAFATGWHALRPQDPWRWSDGDATLALPRLAKPTLLELHLADPPLYWLAPQTPEVARAVLRA